ncbi:MAG: SIR2 family protein [Methylococcales bacterium]|nr:SIR2 family protein [Methylococcales bacterium]
MSRKKKILVVVGAGASIELGMPSVRCINNLFVQWAKDDYSLASNEYDNLYSFFVREIERYKKDHLEEHLRTPTNFEEALYVMYLLPAFFLNGVYTSSIGAFLSGRKLPDIRRLGRHQIADSYVLGSLASYLIELLLHEFRERCQKVECNYKDQLDKWKGFLSSLDNDFEIAIVSLNYDNLVYQALPSLNTGFDPVTGLFKSETIFYRKNWRCLLHLHGSVHFDIFNGLKWIDDLSKAYNPYSGGARGISDRHTQEGGVFPVTEIVIGYGKLYQLQGQPFRTYHAELDRLVHECEGVLFLGYGFSDEHLNSAFSGYHDNRRPPVVVIDYAEGDTMTTSRSCPNALSSAIQAIRIFGVEPTSMQWSGNNYPARVEKLKEINAFESSNDPNTPLSIWYGGMQKACCNYQKIANILGL